MAERMLQRSAGELYDTARALGNQPHYALGTLWHFQYACAGAQQVWLRRSTRHKPTVPHPCAAKGRSLDQSHVSNSGAVSACASSQWSLLYMK